MSGNAKVYLVEFRDKNTHEIVFHKFGHTHHYDAMKRFDYDEYGKWDIRVLKSVYGPEKEVQAIEETLKALYPKNISIPEKISGVTEIVLLNISDVSRIIKAMSKLSIIYQKRRQDELSMDCDVQSNRIRDIKSD